MITERFFFHGPSLKRALFTAALGSAILTPTAMRALAYTPAWFDCTGTVTNSSPNAPPESKPVEEIYGYDDDSRNFYHYSTARKATDVEPVTAYDQRTIKWGEDRSSAYNGPTWDGQFDRTTLALTIMRREKSQTMAWAEQCKAIKSPEGTQQ